MLYYIILYPFYCGLIILSILKYKTRSNFYPLYTVTGNEGAHNPDKTAATEQNISIIKVIKYKIKYTAGKVEEKTAKFVPGR
jgi:hypothetical protein